MPSKEKNYVICTTSNRTNPDQDGFESQNSKRKSSSKVDQNFVHSSDSQNISTFSVQHTKPLRKPDTSWH